MPRQKTDEIIIQIIYELNKNAELQHNSKLSNYSTF